MAAFVLTNSQILVGSFNATTFTGQYADESSVAMQDANVFGGGGFVRKYPGLKSYTTSLEGFADYAADGISTAFTTAALGSQQLVSIAPTGGATAGDPVMFTRALVDTIDTPGGSVGDMASFAMSFTSDTAKAQGQIAAPLTARTTTANGTILNIAGPTAAQRMYAGLHITAVSGTPSLTVTIQSAATVGFTSPTTRITFTAATGVGWQFSSVAGAVTDAYWRAVFTISGSTPSLTCAVVLGTA
jgi:hypothetical protein